MSEATAVAFAVHAGATAGRRCSQAAVEHPPPDRRDDHVDEADPQGLLKRSGEEDGERQHEGDPEEHGEPDGRTPRVAPAPRRRVAVRNELPPPGGDGPSSGPLARTAATTLSGSPDPNAPTPPTRAQRCRRMASGHAPVARVASQSPPTATTANPVATTTSRTTGWSGAGSVAFIAPRPVIALGGEATVERQLEDDQRRAHEQGPRQRDEKGDPEQRGDCAAEQTRLDRATAPPAGHARMALATRSMPKAVRMAR